MWAIMISNRLARGGPRYYFAPAVPVQATNIARGALAARPRPRGRPRRRSQGRRPAPFRARVGTRRGARAVKSAEAGRPGGLRGAAGAARPADRPPRVAGRGETRAAACIRRTATAASRPARRAAAASAAHSARAIFGASASWCARRACAGEGSRAHATRRPRTGPQLTSGCSLSNPPISVVSHSFWLIFGGSILSCSGSQRSAHTRSPNHPEKHSRPREPSVTDVGPGRARA